MWFCVGGCESQRGSAAQVTEPENVVSRAANVASRAVKVAAPLSTRAARPPLPTRFEPPPRIAAIGDVHGDISATRAALRLAGAIGEGSDDWIGGALVVVQTGDQLDRGDDERAILALLEALEVQAAKAGGAVHILNGNHEFMNAAGDFRYVTEGGLAEFNDVPGLDLSDPRIAMVSPPARARAAAFRPGGPYAQKLARRNTVVIVGRTVFVHGGVLPKHVAGGVPDLERFNADTRAWLAGDSERATETLAEIMSNDSVVWTRLYADDSPGVCETLRKTLTLLDVDRMVVGHTVQQDGITSGCSQRVWRIDVGMARHYGGSAQVLIIEGDKVTPRGS
ncbi:MAG: metallophosphoesterase [Nannocystaceae bacterium]|nr:metallophosphoesterase [Nannocystaceae bacterium]